jgi:hypothetical protein
VIDDQGSTLENDDQKEHGNNGRRDAVEGLMPHRVTARLSRSHRASTTVAVSGSQTAAIMKPDVDQDATGVRGDYSVHSP